jgi:tryptophan-rich sensory protein
MEKPKTIIDRIKEGNIKQKPKWYFTSINILYWSFYLLCILFGAASFSVILFVIQQSDFNLISHMSHSRLEFFLALLPFFWIVILLVFLFSAMIVFRKSNRGYKYNWTYLFVLSTTASILLGTLFFIGGGGQKLEEAFAEKLSYYEGVMDNKMKVWTKPEEGFLAGTLLEINKNGILFLDFKNQEWDLEYDHAFISPFVSLEKGEQVKLIGEITRTKHFKVKEMRPWNGPHFGTGRDRNKER